MPASPTSVFPAVNFHPPGSAQTLLMRPFTDVLTTAAKQPGGVLPAQGQHGLQAGVGGLYSFASVLTGTLKPFAKWRRERPC